VKPGSRAAARAAEARFQELHPDWIIRHEVKLPGLAPLSPGTELRIHGEPGRVFRFLRLVETPRGSWVDVYGGQRDPRGERMMRSFDPSRIAQTYRKPQLRKATPND
jgi:hypothetical protein